jgi:hypothetical protein
MHDSDKVCLLCQLANHGVVISYDTSLGGEWPGNVKFRGGLICNVLVYHRVPIGRVG